MKIEKPNPLGSSTILELADDYAKAYFIGRPEEARKLLQAAIMNAEVQKYNAENMVVSRFDEDRLPTFRQGIPTHELEDHVTAQQCEWFVKTIDDLRNEVNRLKDLSSSEDFPDDYEVN